MSLFKPLGVSKKEVISAFVISSIFAIILGLTVRSEQRGFSMTINFLLFFFISIGNGYISDGINISWLKFPVKRFLYNLLFTTIYTPIAATVAIVITALIWLDDPIDAFYLVDWSFYLTILIITYFIGFFLSGRAFLLNWRQSEIQSAKLREAQTAAQYENLQNQVNPHFLFNSLNVLSTLVYKDQDLAAKFIKQMSKVYRYVLQAKDQEVVSLNAELEALEAYVFLIKIRFAEGLEINNELPKSEEIKIAPLTLQMLVENAVKHNTVHKDQPLHLGLYMKDEYIIVENNLQKKGNVQESMGIGLNNIQKRYQYLSDKEINVEETKDSFKVSIPIIKLNTA